LPGSASAPGRTSSSATIDAPPDGEPIPEPPPGYDDDLEPSGGRALAPPPVPEAVYARQDAPSGLTGADRAREALRRAQAARNPVGGGVGSTGSGSRGEPAAPSASGASFEELSADDPDLDGGSSGLVGVPLVVKVLGGTIIDERVEQA
jgi:DNA polymerase-3 subunit gamma/tau